MKNLIRNPLKLLQALTLIALAGFLLEKVISGRLAWYIHPRFLPLTLLAVAGFLLMAGTRLFYLRRTPAHTEAHEHSQNHDHGHDHDHTHSDSQTADRSGWLNLGLLLVPLLIGLLPARPLSAAAIGSKGISGDTPLSLASGAPLSNSDDPAGRTILDWIKLFNFADDLSPLMGQPADVTGFVYPDPRLPADYFMVSRFAIVCCAADAFAIGMVVHAPQATGLSPDAWVRITGVVSVYNLEGRSLPLINAAQVAPAEPPSDPYLFP